MKKLVSVLEPIRKKTRQKTNSALLESNNFLPLVAVTPHVVFTQPHSHDGVGGGGGSRMPVTLLW